ncbi:hypothetical protein IV64_GL001854 [Lactiplantibacillus xiangfangensis]|uniref:Ig-like domain-containing protein n=1 Tax=Lactiplantibacillus xiangfangensis TaxID=942150 RepID=A0A0R2MP66_9LACO|nr:BspA family leucine-rich repeat surface protein [Lactiplantibacillus xiangfangensis]KRO14018.1 hypothetical protein IV64_GL001854 [Lactiplantibacillus xiangfangensis]
MVKNGQLTEVHVGKVTGRFWLMAGAALLTWQINNQVVQADTVAPTAHVTASVNTKVTTGPTSEGSSAAQSTISVASSSAAASHKSQASAARAVSQPASETGTPASSVVNESQAGSEAKSEQSQTGALSQVGSSQAVSEASSAVKDSSAARPVIVKSMARVKTVSQAQLASYRLRMVAPVAPVAAVNDHTSGTLGTSKWSVDTVNKILTIGPGTLADTGVTADADGKVTDWKGLDWNNYQVDGSKPQLTLQLNGPVVVGEDASYLFSGLRFNGNILADGTNLDTSNTTNMTGMFSKASIWASNEDNDKVTFNLATSEVKTMAHMFDGVRLHNEVFTFSKLDMDNVTDLTGMFENAGGETIDLSGLDTSNVVSMAHMFDNCSGATAIDVSSFNTSNVTDMSYMFNQCSLLKTLDLSNFDTSNVTSMASMFHTMSDLTSLNISKLDTRSVTDMSDMFHNDHTPIDLASFNTKKVTNMSGMFRGTYFTEPIKHFEKITTDNVTNMSNMFYFSDLSAMDLSGFNTKNVKDMSGMFSRADNFSTSDIANFDTSNVTNMASMFENVNPNALKAKDYFTTIDLSHFDTSHVKDMSKMFANNKHLTTVNFANDNSKFDTSQVTNMLGMFSEDGALTELDVSSFNTKNVVDMSYMFSNDTQLERLDLSHFDTKNVVDMSYMFSNDTQLERLDLSHFDTKNVVDMSYMFNNDIKLGRLDLRNFETPNLKSVYEMFLGDGALKYLNLANFDTRNIVNKVHGSNGFGLRTFRWFNISSILSDPQDNMVNPQVLVLGANTRLKMDWPMNEVSDVMVLDPSTPGIADITLADIAKGFGYKSVDDMKADLFAAGLQSANTITGLWVNADTGERLTAPALMARYGNDQAVAGTWTWQTIVGKDVTMIAHPNAEWKPADNFDQAVDDDNQALGLDKMTVTLRDATSNAIVNNIDPTKAGRYTVTYSYPGSDNVIRTSGPVALTILANQDNIQVDNIVLELNDTFQAMAHLQGVTNADGSAVDFSNVTTSNTVDSSIPGNYTVTYLFTDLFGDTVQKTVTVVVNGLTLKQDNLNVSTDDHWDPQTNVAATVDDTGKTVAPEEMTVTMTDDAGHVVSNLKRPGQYQVSYSFSDGHGTHSQRAIVTVVAGVNHAGLQLKSDHITIYEHDEWSPLDNVSALTDSDGEPVLAENWAQLLQIDGQVNTAKAGDYPVTYRFVDLFGQTHTATTLVTVKASQAGLTVKKDTVKVYAGTTWEATDNLANVTDIDGSAVDPSQVIINSNVDSTKPGHYLVTYRFTDRQSKLHTATTAVTVLENQAALTLKNEDVQLTVGDAWNATDNVLQATDIDGTAVDAGKLQIDNPVLLNQPGTYLVTYQFTDQLGTVHTAQTRVVLKAKQQPGDGGDDNNGQKPNPEPTPEPNPEPVPEPEPDPEPAPEPKPDPVPNPEPTPENPGQQPKPTTPANPGQQPTSVKPENRPSAEHAKQNPTQRPTGDTVKVKASYQTSPTQLQHQAIKPVQPAQAAVKAGASLPQTDEQNNHRSIAGVLLLALASVGFPWFFKRQK